jgi:hypothetical protein
VAGVLFIRADDHLIVGVRWLGFTVAGSGASAHLTAGTTVPVWSALLSAPTSLVFDVAAGGQIPLTAEGVLAAALNNPVLFPAGGTRSKGVFPNFEWEHRANLGRDMHVSTLASGVLYPLGHRAEFVKATERIYDSAAGGAAVLRTVRVLTILEPVRHSPGDGPIRRAFPYGDVEITRIVFRDLADAVPLTTSLPGVGTVGTHFWPTTLSGARVLFPVACYFEQRRGADGVAVAVRLEHRQVPRLGASRRPRARSPCPPPLKDRGVRCGPQPPGAHRRGGRVPDPA